MLTTPAFSRRYIATLLSSSLVRAQAQDAATQAPAIARSRDRILLQFLLLLHLDLLEHLLLLLARDATPGERDRAQPLLGDLRPTIRTAPVRPFFELHQRLVDLLPHLVSQLHDGDVTDPFRVKQRLVPHVGGRVDPSL